MRITWIVALIFSGIAAAADSVEMETLLFVQAPHPTGPKPGIQVVWIPEPLQKYCLGKTADECSKIDYCNRTTNRNVPMCQKVARIPPYPAGMHPRRMMSITFYSIVPKLSPIKGIDLLQTFFSSQPAAYFDRLSDNVRIKAKVTLTKSANDDDFNVLEILAGPSSN
jgi:hypothetical protein